MARIPLQVAQRGLETGNTIQYPQGGGPVGAAVAGFGQAVAGVGQDLQELQAREQAKRDRENAFDAGVMEDEFRQSETAAQQDAIINADPSGTGMANGIYGEIDPKTGMVAKPGSFDKRFDEYLERMPEGKAREEFARKRELYRQQGFNRMAPAQVERRRQHEALKTVETQNKLINDIMQTDPNDKAAVAALKKRGEEMLDQRDMDALDREKAKLEWAQNSEIAMVKAIEMRDPAAVRRLLGFGAEPGTGVGGTPVENTVSKIIGVESSGNPTAKNPKSSATGLGQFISGTWLGMIKKYRPDLMQGRSTAQILALRTDPTISREMTTKLTQETEAFLNANGLPVTEGNLYLGHFLGTGGARSVLQAPDDMPLASLLSPGTMRANDFLRGKTVGWVKNWAARKMGSAVPMVAGGGVVAPELSNLTLDQRLALLRSSEAAMSDQMAALRAQLELTTSAAPTAIQNTGTFNGPLPGVEQFIAAYGPAEGVPRYEQFQTATQVAGEVHGMRTMPESEISQLVEAAEPVSSGLDSVNETKRYEVLSTAASEIIRQRNADPNSYVRQVFPSVDRAYDVSQQAGITASIAAQEQLGIRNIQPLPTSGAKQTADAFNREDSPMDTRISAVTNMLDMVENPEHRRAMYEQLVQAGLPEITQGAFLAWERGDKPAANRLFTAATTKISDLPGKAPYTDAQINEAVQNVILADGGVGDVYYGIGTGMMSGEDRLRAERDSQLMFNALSLRVRAGEEVNKAAQAVSKDVMGDLRVVTGNRAVNAEILLPEGADATSVLDALALETPKIEALMNEKFADPIAGAPTASGQRAVFSAAGAEYARRVGEEGFWRNADAPGSFVFMNPYTGPVSDAQGKPIVFRPTIRQRTPAEIAAPPPAQPVPAGRPTAAGFFGGVAETTDAPPSAISQEALDLQQQPAPGPSGAPTPRPGDTAAPERAPVSTDQAPATSFSGQALDDAAARQSIFR
jgi:hypothetical protein